MGQSSKTLDIVFIGAGNLATNLGLALTRAGHNIVCVYSRTEHSASILAGKLGCTWTTDLQEVASSAHTCDVAIISVKDTVLAEVASQMPQSSKTLFLHTAGSMPMDTLTMSHHGVFYPMQTFSKERETDFSVVPTFLECNNERDKELLLSLALSITDKVYWLDSERRKSLHLAAVFTCNFANYCYDAASQLLEKDGIPFEVMLPLIQETTDKLQELTPFQAQTGPAVRYDTNVISRHLKMLENEPEKQKLYALMSQMIHDRHGI